MSVGWQIAWSALPAFIVGYSAFAMELTDPGRKKLWQIVMAICGVIVVGCLSIGALWVIWS